MNPDIFVLAIFINICHLCSFFFHSFKGSRDQGLNARKGRWVIGYIELATYQICGSMIAPQNNSACTFKILKTKFSFVILSRNSLKLLELFFFFFGNAAYRRVISFMYKFYVYLRYFIILILLLFLCIVLLLDPFFVFLSLFIDSTFILSTHAT